MNKINIPPERRKHLDFQAWEKEALKNPRFKREYDKLEPEFMLIEAIIDARINKGITQKILAKRMGTKQSVISRLESGHGNPSFYFLKRLANALNTNLEIKFTSR
jgi:ribosome-binding protein aMBF1 (putative translation factor)